jgi:hypothetical protein
MCTRFPHGVRAFLLASTTDPGYLVFTNNMAQLIGTQLLEMAIKATIATGRVENSDSGPLSMLLIAAPESGKTSLVDITCKTTKTFADITGRGIADTLKSNQEITHIVILDLVAIMSHKQTVNQYTFAILNAMTEEGLSTIAYPGSTETFAKGKRGLIACLTLGLAKDGRNWWNKTGFTSRMLPLCFEHSATLVMKIKEAITAGHAQSARPTSGSGELWLPDHPVTVLLPNGPSREIMHLATGVSAQLNEYMEMSEKEKGYRRLKQFRALAKGHALLRNPKKPVVGKEEIEFLKQLFPYVSFMRPCQI